MRMLWILIAALAAPWAQAAYRCVDEKGITHIGDTPPIACSKVPMYEIGRTGAVLRKIDPTPTPEELKRRLEEQARLKEEEKARAEQKRKDWALLSTYASERDFEMSRDHSLEPINGRIKIAKERIVAVDKRQQELEDEMEFYKAGKSKASKVREAPPQLVQDLERNRAERATLVKSIAASEKEIEEVKARFETDKRRWMALKRGTLQPGMLAGPGVVDAKALEAKAPEAAKPTEAKK